MGCGDAGRIVANDVGRGLDDRSREQRDPTSGKSEGGASGIAVTQAAALPGLAVVVLLIMGVADAGVRPGILTRRRVPVRPGGLANGEATVHGTGMQLRRLGQTNGEPQREHAGETSRDPVTTHGSNIRWERADVRPEESLLLSAILS